MYKSVSLAAIAALNGDGAEEFDTQRCLQLQEEILSSSPERPAADNNMSFPVVASSNHNYNIDATNNARHVTGNRNHQNQAQEVFHEIEAARESDINAQAYGEIPLPSNPVHKSERTRDGPPVLPTVKRDNGKKLRPSDITGNLLPLPCAQLRAMEGEEYTQKSNLSLTQENPESLYEALELQRLRDQAVLGPNDEFSSSPPIPIERNDLPDPQSNGISGDSNFTHTESTARTYEENDTGHINFDTFQPTSVPDEGYLQSEDPPAIYSTQDPVQDTLLDPQTPAPSVNPFSEKGSVMKQHELFGATQPSSIGRLGGSPTSSRPSPDVFEGYRSSQEVEPSPLVRRSEVASATTQQLEQSPDRSTSTETPIPVESATVSNKIQSFNSALRKLTLVREPQDTYIPMKESQERRNTFIQRQVYSGSESDSDIEALPKKFQQVAREKQKLRAQTALVGRRPTLSNRPDSAKEASSISATAGTHQRTINHQRKSSEVTSSHTPQAFESTPIAVEVPASGRRRSMQDYMAQCEGFDARDTQPTQQDMVADSQGIPLSSNLVTSSPVLGPRNRAPASSDIEKACPESTSPSQRLPRKPQQPLSQDLSQPLESKSVNHADGIQEKDPIVPTPSDQMITELPDEVSVSDAVEEPVTQIQNLPSEGVASTVPETSPAADRLIPMTEIAEISLSIANNDELDDLPGFNVDDEFNEIIGISGHHTPKRQSQFQTLLATTPNRFDIIPNGSAATASSGLSSAPSTIEPPTPVARTLLTSTVRDVSEVEAVDCNSSGLELSTEPSELKFSADISKAAPEDVPSPLASTEHDAKPSQTAPIEEPQLPMTKREQESVYQRTPRKSTRFSNGKFGKPPITQQQPGVARNTRLSSVSSIISNPLSSTAESDLVSPSVSNSKSSARGRSRGRPRGSAATKAKKSIGETALPATKRHRNRSPVSPEDQEDAISAFLLNRPSILPSQEDSEDPLALSTPPSKTSLNNKKSIDSLFEGMAFAVSYVDAEKDKQVAIRLIKQHGGRILDDGFENLFTPTTLPSKSRTGNSETGEAELEIASSELNIGFVALIADEHSRKAKYMQALALGLPCISGRWVSDCVEKCTIIDWLPYLLSAGNSSFLGGAVKSRYLRPYSAFNANLNDIFTQRLKLLDGKSILIVTGKGKAGKKRKPYTFLTRALGPTRLDQAQDLKQAREMLLDAESKNVSYDWLYVDGKQDVETVVFENTPASTSGGGRKRKRVSIQQEDASPPLSKRIRVVNDEVMIQSLILGQLIED
ncbi:hypothetical protein BHYA_0224g00040 [Botrytis hyacinthi]|uniref:BRCT domain-containing protein n=1 Tax=Botrytis hyacinthi TaxID=278943 RepID=A0A4Z1GEL8_9HELO|nr:hypothetical protein BHYA_0224g00040 [Botrytis hyacinthi]